MQAHQRTQIQQARERLQASALDTQEKAYFRVRISAKDSLVVQTILDAEPVTICEDCRELLNQRGWRKRNQAARGQHSQLVLPLGASTLFGQVMSHVSKWVVPDQASWQLRLQMERVQSEYERFMEEMQGNKY